MLVKRVLLLPLVFVAACGVREGASDGEQGAGGAPPLEHGSTTVSASYSSVTVSSSSTGLPADPDDPFGCLAGPIPARPPAIPEGYRPYGCWSSIPSCLLWIPDDPETQVAPVEWEPCVTGSPGGDGCRQMKRAWPHGERRAIEVVASGGPQLDTRGPEPLLRVTRLSLDDTETPYVEYLVASVDGPVRYAMRVPYSLEAPCRYQDYDLTEGTWVIGPYGGDSYGDPQQSPHDGALVVDVATRAISLPHRDEGPEQSSYKTGANRLLRYTGPDLLLQSPPGAEDVVLHRTANDPIGAHPTFNIESIGDRVVWDVFTTHTLGIRAYDPERGGHDLLRYLDDPSRGAGGVGTDGVDLVWMEGSGRVPGEHHYPMRDIMTSPFTTDPAALQPRRLRSQISTGFGADSHAFKVGCGRAARAGATTTSDTQIVRLSDGWGWELVHTPMVWQSMAIAGLTCDEVFLVVQSWTKGKLDGPTIQRIRFDALGDGTPPD